MCECCNKMKTPTEKQIRFLCNWVFTLKSKMYWVYICSFKLGICNIHIQSHNFPPIFSILEKDPTILIGYSLFLKLTGLKNNWVNITKTAYLFLCSKSCAVAIGFPRMVSSSSSTSRSPQNGLI